MNATPSHLDLLAAARSLRRAAAEGERDAVHAELCRLRSALLQHLHAEQEPTAALHGAVGMVARAGQQRIVNVLNELLFRTEADDDCNCIVRAAEVEVMLRRQAKLEAIALRAAHIGARDRSASV